jgi:hypothetical protein
LQRRFPFGLVDSGLGLYLIIGVIFWIFGGRRILFNFYFLKDESVVSGG